MSKDSSSAADRGSGFSAGLGLVERLRHEAMHTGYKPTKPWDLLMEAADEIERAWAARDAAVADLEAHAAAEVRRAVAAERERCAKLRDTLRRCNEAMVLLAALAGSEHNRGIAWAALDSEALALLGPNAALTGAPR